MTAPVIRIYFPGGKRVDADFGAFVVPTDQRPKSGGEGTAPEPYDLFLASIGTCAGYYVLAFCRSRKIPLEGVYLVQRQEFSEPGHVLSRVFLEIHVPAGFPEKYYKALENAAAICGVKKAIVAGPEFVIETRVGDGES